MNESGYVTYARPDNGRTVFRAGQELDNTWVAPYSPELLLLLDCHCNVEPVIGIQSVKYLYKYMWKGPDRAELVIDCSETPVDINEPKIALDGRLF